MKKILKMKPIHHELVETISSSDIIDEESNWMDVTEEWNDISDSGEESIEEETYHNIGFNILNNQLVHLSSDNEDECTAINLQDNSVQTLDIISKRNFHIPLLSIRDSSIPMNYFDGDYDHSDLVANESIIKNLMMLLLYKYGNYKQNIYIPWNNPIESLISWEEYIFSYQYYDTVLIPFNLKDFLQLDYFLKTCFKDFTMLLGLFELFLTMNGKGSFMLMILSFIQNKMTLSDFVSHANNPINTYNELLGIECLHGGFCPLNRANYSLLIKKKKYQLHEFLDTNLYKKWSSTGLTMNDQEATSLESKILEFKRFLTVSLPNLRNLNQFLSDELIGITFPSKEGFTIVDTKSLSNLIEDIKGNTNKSTGCVVNIILEFSQDQLKEVITKDFTIQSNKLKICFISNKIIVRYDCVCLFIIARNKVTVIEGARYILYPEEKIACIDNLLVTTNSSEKSLGPTDLKELLSSRDYNFVYEEDPETTGIMII